MYSAKRQFRLTAVCGVCGYKITQDVEVEFNKISAAKEEFVKKVASIHKQHPDPNQFQVTDKLL
jgi:hypothetical protein